MFEGIVRHQKKFLVGLIVVLMVVWLGAGGLTALLSKRSGAGVIARIYGEDVGDMEFRNFAFHWSRTFGEQVWPSDREEARQAIAERMAEVRFAEKLGLSVGDDELRAYIEMSVLPGLDRSGMGYREYLRFFRQQDVGDFEATIRQKLLLDKLERLFLLDVERTVSQKWLEFKDGRRRVKVDVAEVGIDRFLPEVGEPAEEEVRDYYELHKEDELKIPEKYKISYVWASYEDMKPLVPVTEEDLWSFYEDENDLSGRWEIKKEPEPSGEDDAPDAASQGGNGDTDAVDVDTAEAAASDAEEALPDDADDAPAEESDAVVEEPVKPDDPDDAPVEESDDAGEDARGSDEMSSDDDIPDEEEAPQYRPFAQVREEVEAAYRQEYAPQVAEDALDKVRSVLDELIGESEMAGVEMVDEAVASSGALGIVQGCTDYFSLDNAPDIPDIEGVSPIGYAGTFIEDVEFGPRLDNNDGVLFYVLVGREAARVPELDEVSDRVVALLARSKAHAMLEEFIDALAERARTRTQGLSVAEALDEEGLEAQSKAFAEALDEEGLEAQNMAVSYHRTYEFSSDPYAPAAFKMPLGEIGTHIEEDLAYIYRIAEVTKADYNAFLQTMKAPEKREGPYNTASYIEAQKLRPYFMDLIRNETGLELIEEPEDR